MREFKIYKYLAFSFLCLLAGMVPLKADAFSCSNNGTQTIYVDLILSDSDAMDLVTDMSTYTTCSGNVGPGSQNDALRTKSFTISNSLSSEGFTGYFQTVNSTFPDTTSIPICVWPADSDMNCDPLSQAKSISESLKLKIYVARTGISTSDNLILKAGSEVARISLDQHSVSSWGWTRTWIFVLKNDVPIPAHTCDVDASTPSTVALEPASSSSMLHKGSTSQSTNFSVKLKCQGNVNVAMLLDGQQDQDATDEGVLVNNPGMNSASGVGIQILFGNNPVMLGQTFTVGTSTDGIYDIPMQARYYRTSVTPVKGGDVSAFMTYNMTYK